MKRLTYIRKRGDELEWFDANTRQTGTGSATEVLAAHNKNHIVYILPGTEVTLTTVNLPTQSPAKLRLAAPFALEEKLAANAETLHCGLGPAISEGSYAVAVIDRNLADEVRDLLLAHDIDHASAVADVHCLALASGLSDTPTWSLLYEPGHVVIRTGQYSGFACEPELLNDYLQMLDKPENLQWQITLAGKPVADSPEDAALAEFFAEHGIREDSCEIVSQPLLALAHRELPLTHISLLQGDYAIEPGYQRMLAPLKPVAALLALWLVIGGVAHALGTQHKEAQLAQLEADASIALKRAFPEIKKVSNLRNQAMQRLRNSGTADDGRSFLLLLSEAATAITSINGLSLHEAQYRRGALALSLRGPGVESLDALKQHFATKPDIALNIESANAGEKGMQIRASLSREAKK